MFLLDTNHCSQILKGENLAREKLSTYSHVEFTTCVIVMGELFFMAQNSEYQANNLEKVNQFLSSLRVLNIDSEIAKIYGELKADLFKHFAPNEKNKRRNFNVTKSLGISDNDLWISSIAIKHELIVLSRDSDFQKIRCASKLKTESWYPIG